MELVSVGLGFGLVGLGKKRMDHFPTFLLRGVDHLIPLFSLFLIFSICNNFQLVEVCIYW